MEDRVAAEHWPGLDMYWQ